MSSITARLLEEGAIYIRGRDTGYHPLIFLDFSNINLQERLVDEYIDLGVRLMEY
jgi:hypothetical protein